MGRDDLLSGAFTSWFMVASIAGGEKVVDRGHRLLIETRPRDRRNLGFAAIDHAYPRHLKFPVFDRDSARIAEKVLTTAGEPAIRFSCTQNEW